MTGQKTNSSITTCPLCGYSFDLNESRTACGSCSVGKLSSGCRFIRCPNCSYEIPPEPKFVARIRKWREKRSEKAKR